MANNFKNQTQRTNWNKYNNAYSKKNYKTICIKLRLVEDKDIIDFLYSLSPSPTKAIKALVKEKLGTGK